MRVSVKIVTGGVVVAFVAAAGACGVTPPAGTIPGPAASVSMSGAALYALASNPARWSQPHEAERSCTGDFWCALGKKIKVDIYADVNARNVGPNPGNAAGTLMGKLVNKGNATEARYFLERGPYQYLLFVFPRAAGADGRWVIVQVENAPPHNQKPVSEGVFHGCGHTTSWTASFARFVSCSDGPPAQPSASMRSGVLAPVAVRTAGFSGLPIFQAIKAIALGHEDPAWFTCTSGCCVAVRQ